MKKNDSAATWIMFYKQPYTLYMKNNNFFYYLYVAISVPRPQSQGL